MQQDKAFSPHTQPKQPAHVSTVERTNNMKKEAGKKRKEKQIPDHQKMKRSERA